MSGSLESHTTDKIHFCNSRLKHEILCSRYYKIRPRNLSNTLTHEASTLVSNQSFLFINSHSFSPLALPAALFQDAAAMYLLVKKLKAPDGVMRAFVESTPRVDESI